MIVPKNLSLAEIRDYSGSILVFLGLFALLSSSIGLLTAFSYENERKQIREIYPVISISSIAVLAFLLYPYYGDSLMSMALPIGVLSYLLGLFFVSPTYRKRTVSKIEISLMIISSIVVIAFLVIKIIPAWLAIVFLLVYIILLGIVVGLFLGSFLLNCQKKRGRRKRRKKS